MNDVDVFGGGVDKLWMVWMFYGGEVGWTKCG